MERTDGVLEMAGKKGTFVPPCQAKQVELQVNHPQKLGGYSGRGMATFFLVDNDL